MALAWESFVEITGTKVPGDLQLIEIVHADLIEGRILLTSLTTIGFPCPDLTRAQQQQAQTHRDKSHTEHSNWLHALRIVDLRNYTAAARHSEKWAVGRN